jgi:hypothetical protein
MLAGLPDVVRHYFELDPRDVDGFVALFSDDAIVVDEARPIGGRARSVRGERDRQSSTPTRRRSSTKRAGAATGIWLRRG